MVLPNRVVGTFIVHCICSFSVFLRRDSAPAVRKEPGHDVPLLIESLYGLNSAGFLYTVGWRFGVGVLML